MGLWQVMFIVLIAMSLAVDLCQYNSGERDRIWNVILSDMIILFILWKGGFFT